MNSNSSVRKLFNRGEIIAGRYEIAECLGIGGMGAVYACFDKKLKNHIKALKVLWPQLSQNKAFLGRFQREIICSYNVSHPNVVRAYEYLEEDGLIGFTMEYIQGENLFSLMSKIKRFDATQVRYILQEICLGLIAIHDVGIIHRDLKPENIIITDQGKVKITDFGIAYLENEASMTAADSVVGTFEYLCPEAILQEKIDQRSDIYCLGVVAYHLLTGISPFKGMTFADRIKTCEEFVPEKPSSTLDPSNSSLDHIIMHCLQPKPGERFLNAHELLFQVKSQEWGENEEQIRSKIAKEISPPEKLKHKRFYKKPAFTGLFFVLLILFWLSLFFAMEDFLQESEKEKSVDITHSIPEIAQLTKNRKSKKKIHKEGNSNYRTITAEDSDIIILSLDGKKNTTSELFTNRKSPLVSPTPFRLTRLRISQTPVGTWKHERGVLYLINVRAGIRNVGTIPAKKIQVKALIPGGMKIKLNGPKSLEANRIGEYESGNLQFMITKSEKLKLEIHCSNCRK